MSLYRFKSRETGDLVMLQPLGGHQDLVLLEATADRHDLGDARHR